MTTPLQRYAHRPPADIERIVRRAAVAWFWNSALTWVAVSLAAVARAVAR